MPFKGTDKDAYAKASKGKTPKQRSKIYYREKAKNERKLEKSTIPTLQQTDLLKTARSFSTGVKQAPRIQDNSSVSMARNFSAPYKSKPEIQPKTNIEQQLKNLNSIIWDKTLDGLSDAFKDKIVDLTLELIKNNTNEQIERIIDAYQTIEKYIKVAQKIYKVIIEINERINKFSIKYEQQNDEDSKLKYNKEYEKNKAVYLKHEDISNCIIFRDLDVWRLGKNKKQANKLYKLVLKGKKIATSYLYNENEKLASNDYSILTNWDKNRQLLILTTNIEIVPFNKVTKQHVQNEGEGTKTLRFWRKIHKKLFTKELEESKKLFTDETLIVCKTFKIERILK